MCRPSHAVCALLVWGACRCHCSCCCRILIKHARALQQSLRQRQLRCTVVLRELLVSAPLWHAASLVATATAEETRGWGGSAQVCVCVCVKSAGRPALKGLHAFCVKPYCWHGHVCRALTGRRSCDWPPLMRLAAAHAMQLHARLQRRATFPTTFSHPETHTIRCPS